VAITARLNRSLPREHVDALGDLVAVIVPLRTS
jgi:hypothetical protein